MEKNIKKVSFYVDRNLRSRSRSPRFREYGKPSDSSRRRKDLDLLGEELLVDVQSRTGSVSCATKKDVMLRSAEMKYGNHSLL